MAVNWLDIAKKLKWLSQAGKSFTKDEYDKERYLEIEIIAADIIAHHSQLEQDQSRTIIQEDFGYPTPKTDTRGAVFKDGKILLVKEIEDGKWTLPGGWCDNGLTPAENVVREIWEESGYETKVVRLCCVYDRDKQGHTPPYPFNIYKFFFLCEITGGQAKSSNETSEISFFAENEIPQLSQSRTLKHEIHKMFEYYRDSSLAACCD